MLFTGNNFRLTPEVTQMGFIFSGLSINGTGIAEIGFSGENNILKFTFNNRRIFSPSGKFIGSYNTGQQLTLKGFIDTNNYQYFIDNDLLANRVNKPNFHIQKFFINATGTSVSSEVQLTCADIPYSINIDSNFLALGRLSGSLTNNSNINFKVFDSAISYFRSNSNLLSGIITGTVSGNQALSFSLADLNTSRFDSEVAGQLTLLTTIGEINTPLITNRVSGLDIIVNTLSTSSDNTTLSVPFDGSGNIANTFTYTPTTNKQILNFFIDSINLHGQTQIKNAIIKFEPVYPLQGSGYRADYVTGFTLSSSGEYLYPPRAMFTGYYYVSGLDINPGSVILSSGCSGNLPVIFTGAGGNGASGIFINQKTLLNNIYDVGINTYYLPQSFSMLSGGTGYLGTPTAILQTGIYNNCYDVAAKYGTNLYVYTPFSGHGILVPAASYLTGVVLYKTGLVSGGAITGYILTGLEITNPGSGYNSLYIPKISFLRQSGDTLTKNATGVFFMKTTGFYNFSGQWSIQTGVSNTGLAYMIGQSGTGYFNSFQNNLSTQVNYSGLDNTEAIVSKVTVTLPDGTSVYRLMSGIKSYDTSTGYLKKKNNLELTLFAPSADLSFSLTQNELDTYYSSNEFINNNFEILLGDLDF
jgi:hypothetical protein